MIVFHIVPATEWEAAMGAGTYRPASLAAEGFIHFSYADQVAATANRYYRDRDGLVVVAVDLTGVPGEVRVESSPATGELFPHLYDALPTSHALSVYPLRRNDSGDYVFSPDASDVSASPDR
jgi:uncharacterized protein (DUF952 family)